MRKKMVSALTMLSVLLVLSATCAPSMATTYTVGVPVGATADYSVGWTGFAINRSHIEVTGVSGTVITFTKIEYNPDGSVNNTHKSCV